MKLDVRQPMGGLFVIHGVILVGFGLLSDPVIYARHSLGININLLWGAGLAAFGATMLWLAWKRTPEDGAAGPADDPDKSTSLRNISHHGE